MLRSEGPYVHPVYRAVSGPPYRTVNSVSLAERHMLGTLLPAKKNEINRINAEQMHQDFNCNWSFEKVTEKRVTWMAKLKRYS